MATLKWILLGFLGVVLALVLYLTLIFDLNSFKPEISAQVAKLTGRELTIDGPIGLSVFPTLGVELEKVALSNLPDEALPPLVAFEQASVGVALMPLLKRQLEVKSLVIRDAVLNLVTLEDGRTSLTGLGGEGEQTPAAEQTPTQRKESDWRLGQLEVLNITVNNDNRQTESYQSLALESLTLQSIEPGRAAPLALKLALQDPQLSVATEAEALLTLSRDFSRVQIDGWDQQIELSGAAIGEQPLTLALALDADLDIAQQAFQLPRFQVVLDQFQFEGNGQLDLAGVRPKLTLKGEGNHLDLTPWMPETTDEPEQAPSTPETPPSDGPAQEPDLSALGLFDLDLAVGLTQISAPPYQILNPRIEVQLTEGVLSLNRLAGGMFEGQFNMTAKLDSNPQPARYQFEQRIEQLAIQSLLKTVADTEVMAGTGLFTLKGQGQGLTADSALPALQAQGQLALEDGAVYGVNVAKMVRDGQARLKGDMTSSSEAQKTDFSSFSTQLAIAKGSLTTSQIKLASPLLRLDGNGQVNLLSQALDYDLVVSIVGSLEGQGGKGIDQLKDVPIPLKIAGTPDALSYQLDLDAMMKQQLDQEKDKLEKKLKDKLLEKLGEF
ncbi:AsmA family protein [Ferrimonas marina]|nr:AsmA family protein [Ferrimonas marina]